MKSTDFVKKVKELTGTNNLDDALSSIEQLLEGDGPPFGILLSIDPKRNGQYFAQPFGVEMLSDMQMLKQALQNFIVSQADPLIDQLKEQEIRARVTAEMTDQSQEPPLPPSPPTE